MDRVLFVKPRCYSTGGARILELDGTEVEKAFENDPAQVEEWVEFILASSAGDYGLFIWSGNYEDSSSEPTIRRPNESEWALFRSGNSIWSDHQSNRTEETGITFDVFRVSDRVAGRVGADVTAPPIEGAVFNVDECRWELRINSIEELANAARQTGEDITLSFPPSAHGDLPTIDVKDADDIDM
ncbi:hypothetical protein WME99_35835 [Sorangium sp. So ce136]|uniref:hypothetical protein n=1 Tax=Sorangium sp. So ce136 TaxID=3133284 RepID=UPI003EFF4687